MDNSLRMVTTPATGGRCAVATLTLAMAVLALAAAVLLAAPAAVRAADKPETTTREVKKAKAVKEEVKKAKPMGKLTEDEKRALIPVTDARAPASTVAPPTRALPVAREDVEIKPKKGKKRPSLPTISRIKWYGHAFMYLTSSTGVRVAIDPFGANVVTYPFPIRLPADIVLVSSLADDREGGEQLFGNPPVYRANVSIGRIRANGLDLKGVQSFCDVTRKVTNTIYVLRMDGMTFVHLGNLGQVLDARQREEIGTADVLFLNAGTLQLTVEQLNRIALDLGARIIIPIACKTSKSGPLLLRPVDEFLHAKVFPVQNIGVSELTLSPASLPTTPTIYLLKEHNPDAADPNAAPAPAPAGGEATDGTLPAPGPAGGENKPAAPPPAPGT
ncbi:hypothetical protein DB346_06290 [Verrucomicrobia bacterium LW23]|nr:hypothetical protein DB346_06290 [Verrucomicrobia bacterium LW23]